MISKKGKIMEKLYKIKKITFVKDDLILDVDGKDKKHQSQKTFSA
jgi:hypothetical protein